MSSRLDRLFLLLDTGSSPVTRKAAALQLGEVQKLHPHELHNLLAKVRTYLHSSSWDTRIAAGQAVEAVISNVPQWRPTACSSSEDKKAGSSASVAQAGRMKFSQFDINKVIQNGSDLLASEGTEYETDVTVGDSKERLAKQRQLLNERLGLNISEKIGLDTSEIFTNADLEIAQSGLGTKTAQDNKKALEDVFKSEISHLSSRDLSKSKRRAKVYSKQKSKDIGEIPNDHRLNDEQPPRKVQRVTSILVEQQSSEDAVVIDSVMNTEDLWEDSKEWPFESFCDELAQDLFSPSWEVRHGAATALREVVRLHGNGAGKSIDMLEDKLDLMNWLWLEDIALRLLCVLALDKFGDFISDQVVAPVRETCAQALGTVLFLMTDSGVEGVLYILLQLLERPEWEARHGGLLGLKYVLAVRQDMAEKIVPLVFQPVCRGLQDPIDDVSAVAAAALIPVTNIILKTLPLEVPKVVLSLWDSLLELDDLTASTCSIIMLLASLLSFSNSNGLLSLPKPLNDLVPRLWPFLGHNSSSVRKSVLQALVILTSDNNSQFCENWLPYVLPNALRLIYQRSLTEHQPDILELLHQVWKQILSHSPTDVVLRSTCPHLGSWLCLLMQPQKVPIDPRTHAVWLEIIHKPNDKTHCRGRKWSSSDIKELQEQFYIGGSETLSETPVERERSVARARWAAAKFLGYLSSYITKPLSGNALLSNVDFSVGNFSKLLLFHLNSKSALQRLAIALVLLSWAECEKENLCPLSVKDKCWECLNEGIYYDEIALSFTRMQQECRDLVAFLNHHKVHLPPPFHIGGVLTVEQATALATTVFHSAVSACNLKPKVMEDLEERRKSLLRTVTQTNKDQLALSIVVQSSLAGALIAFRYLPEKLNPIIRPLMESIKKEENILFQESSARHLVRLIGLCVERTSSPNAKIIKNVISCLCSDPLFTPNLKSLQYQFSSTSSTTVGSSRAETPAMMPDLCNGILTLINMQKSAEKATLRRCNSLSGRKNTSTSPEVQLDEALLVSDDETQKQNELQRRGATFVLKEAAKQFEVELPKKLSKLWDAIFHSLTETIHVEKFDGLTCIDNDNAAQELVNSLQVLEVVGPSLHPSLHNQLENILLHICCCLEHPYSAVRHMAARCMGMLSKVITVPVMNVILENLLKKLGATDNDVQRQGAIEAISCIIDSLYLSIVPYIVFLVVPVLGRMCDQNKPVRLMATHCFASLIRLMPLEEGIKDSPSLHPDLLEKKAKEQRFLEQLMNPKKLDTFKVPVPVAADLRSYQQEGVNWLAFLSKYKLHGILCDDMGLGKTLQSLCILAADHHNREQNYLKTSNPDSKPLPSLVVCPPTLTGHWMYEVIKFISPQYLNPLHYTGPPSERIRLRSKTKKYNLIIASYDIVRNDIDFFSSIHWNYCILDEGHIIKNGKTKLAKAIKQLPANHRLILSGTPIQNNVLELWSLFDFLMPGFLGSEKQFTARYSKPILQSRDAKSSSKEQEAGILAMESLHRQVLPFLLRRMKEDVLQDLPPKIIQDYYCELSALQIQLYEDFAKSRARKNLEDTLGEDESNAAQSTNSSHIFQALQYLRKVCNHPKLVLTPQHPEYDRVLKQLKQQNSDLQDIQHAAKLCALRQLLQDCGIGVTSQNETEPVVSQHRALVFCQLKSTLDILEYDLFKVHMPSVSYLRLDGSIPPSRRHGVVHQFNNDPSIDVLLLTTQVGGLGLNLTGADTVIFVEHDWNPMKDLQAMDRAHRIGQKKVVNVYRLITRGTLEEKIMGLQKFKLTIANTVISQENSSLQTMGTDQLLDLFTLDHGKIGERKDELNTSDQLKSAKGKGMKSVLENLPELWDTEQYDAEYDLGNFLQSLKK